MADQFDGSIVINTELDNSGFDKGSDKLLAAVKELTAKIDTIGESVKGSLAGAVEILSNIAEGTAAIYKKLSGGVSQATDANAQFTSAMGETKERVSQSAQAVDSYDRALAKVQKQIEAAEGKLAGYYQELERIKATSEEWMKAATTDDQRKNIYEVERIELEKLDAKYAAQLKALSDLEAEYGRLAEAKKKAAEVQVETAPTSVPAATSAPAANAVKHWQALGKAVKTTEALIKKVGATLAKPFRDAAKGASIFTGRLKNLASHSNSAKAQANALAKSLLSLKNMLISRIKRTFISAVFNEAKEGLRLLAVYSDSFNRAMSNISNASARLSANVSAALGRLIEQIEPIVTKIINGISKAITYVSAFFGILTGKNTMIVAKKQTDSYRESVAGAAKQANTYGDSLSSATNQTKSYNDSLSGMSSQAAKYGDTTKQATNRTDAYTGSAEDATEAVKDLNRQMHSFDELNKRSADDADASKDALDDLAGSLADTYDPSNYPDLNNYPGSNYEPSNPSNPSYNPYGNLDPEAVQDAADMFEEVPIESILPEKLSDLFNELKKLWDEGDFFGFGKLLGEGLGSLLQSIDDWINNVLRPKGVEWAGIAAEVLNGVVNGLPWELLGKTIADGLNAVFDIVNTFLTKFHFDELGKGIGRAIRDWFDNVEWDLIGETFANKWNALIDTIHGIVTTPGLWKSIGSGIGEFISSEFATIKFPELGDTIAKSVEGVATALKFAAKEIKERAHEISDNFSAGLNNIFNADWGDVAKQASNFITTILDVLLETARKTDWEALGRSIGDFLGNIEWGKIFGKVAAIIWEVASGVIDGLLDTKGGRIALLIGAKILAIKGLFDAAKIAGVVAQWVNAIGTAFPAALPAVTTFASGIATALGGIIPAATTFVSGLGAALAPIAAAIFSPTGILLMAIAAAAVLIIANWDKIKEAATQLADWIGQAWDKLKTYTVEKWDSLKTTVSQKAGEIRTSVVNAWSNLKTEAGQKWEEVKTAVSDKFSQIKPVVTTTAEGIKTNLKQSWDDVKQATQTAWGNIHTAIKDQFEKVKTPVDNTLKTVKQNLSTNWTNIKTDTQRAWENIKTTITRPLQQLPQTIRPAGDQVKTSFQQIWSGVNTTSQSAWRTILSGLQSMWSSIQSGLSSMFSYVSSGISSLLSRAQQGMSNAWNTAQNIAAGLGSGLAAGWNTVKNGAANLLGKVNNFFTTRLGIHSPSTVFAEYGKFLDLGLAEGVDKYKRNVLSSVSGMSKDVTKEVNTNDAAFKIGAESNDLVSNLTNVTTHLSKIAGIFSEINKTLSGMGGMIAPAISTGSVVPYATKVSPTPKTTGTDLSGLSDGIDGSERMYDMVSLLRRILEVLERNGKLDKDDLAAALSFAMRGESRGFGAI